MSPGVVVGELVIIEAQQVKDGAVDVANVVDAIDGFSTEVVGGTDGMTGMGAAASEPHRHGFGIVVTTVVGPAITVSVVRGPSKFAAPDDEGFFEHPPFFKIFQEGRNRFVDRANQ